MWRLITIAFVALAVAAPVVTGLLREVVHYRRARHDGLGGTQDIAMWRTLAGLACLLGAGVSSLLWYLTG